MSRIYSTQNMPIEVLREIFGQVVGPIGLHRNRDHFSDSKCHNPWELALVCKNWRDAVFLIPSIWCNISLDIVPSKSHKHDALLLALNLCLERSRSHSLVIELIGSDNGKQSDRIPALVKAVMDHAPRWESVSIKAPIPSTYFSKHPVQYTRLSRIELEYPFQLYHETVGLFEDAPRLSHVTLFHYPKRFQNLTWVGIPWSQITHLHMTQRFAQLEDLIDILNCTPNLEELEYEEWSNYFYGEGEELPTLKLPQLRRLVWECLCRESDELNDARYDPGPVGPATMVFFQMLEAPRLAELLVRGSCGNEDIICIGDCIERSQCSITHLCLPTLHIFPLFSHLPDIKTLVCVNDAQNIHADGDEIFNNGDKFKHLEKLVCGNFHLRPYDTRLFFRLFQAPRLSDFRVTSKDLGVLLEDIRDFLLRSKCSIKTLCIIDLNLSVLRDVTFDVETLILPPDTLQYLMPITKQLTFNHSSDSWLFPKLKRIEFNMDITAGPESEAFVRMLETRLRPPPGSLAQLVCEKIRELELGSLVKKPMRQWFQEKLQERMVIAWEELSDQGTINESDE